MKEYPWQCPDCDYRLDDWPYEVLAESGGPVCPECDIDLELVSEE